MWRFTIVFAVALSTTAACSGGSSPQAGQLFASPVSDSDAQSGVPTYDYRTPGQSVDSGGGPCRRARFSIEKMQPTGHVYQSGETLDVTIRYHAPGCDTVSAGFCVRHTIGSPRYQYYCGPGRDF